MKTVTVISDTHGNMSKVFSTLDGVFRECDYIIHLGDTSVDGARVKKEYGDKTVLVNGNCDPVKLGEDEVFLDIEGVKIFATHGHLYSAKSTLQKLYARGKEKNCSLVLYGHTHRADETVTDGITLVNPGNFTRYAQNSYCYLVIHGGKFTCKIVEV